MSDEPERTDAQPRGLTPFGRTVAFSGCALLFLGLAFGSYPYLLCALLLLGVAFWARALPAPALEVARTLGAQDVRAGDPVEVVVEARNVGAAPVALTLHDRVPDPFLLETGANVAAAWLAPGETAQVRYGLRAPRRGQHALGPLRATSHDPTFLQSAPVAEAPETSELTVHPRSPPVPRIKTASAWGRTHLPGGDRATRGILTNDFRELRPYARGDPLKQVNWKATARMSRDDLELIVNDYEVEGKKVVWVFCDASPYTVGGTTLTNRFDELAHGALAVAGHYLDMGHRVGFTLFGSGHPRVVYPDSGDLQERRIAAALAAATPGEPGEGIAAAVEATKGFLAREKPLLFVFTLAGRDPALPRALVSARALASTGRRPAPVVCVAPILDEPAAPAPPQEKPRPSGRRVRRAPETVDPALAARLMQVHERAQLKGLERRGVTVLRYHPERAPLSALLSRGLLP